MKSYFPILVFFFLVFGLPILTRFIFPVSRKILRNWRYERTLSSLLETGKRTSAVVKEIIPGVRIHRAMRDIYWRRERNVESTMRVKGLKEEYYTPDHGLEWTITLQIRMSHLTEIEVKKSFVLSRSQYFQIIPGKTLDVVLDPSDPKSVEIFWDRAPLEKS